MYHVVYLPFGILQTTLSGVVLADYPYPGARPQCWQTSAVWSSTHGLAWTCVTWSSLV